VTFVKVGFHGNELAYFLIYTGLSNPVFLSTWERGAQVPFLNRGCNIKSKNLSRAK